MEQTPITVLGAGAWGTALAVLIAGNGCRVRLWDRNVEHVNALQSERENKRYLNGVTFPETLSLHADFADACAGVNDFLIVVPSHAFSNVLQRLKPYANNKARLAWATKGIDPQTCDLLQTVAENIIGKNCPMAVLAGPNFAKEIGQGLPAAMVVASNDDHFATDLIYSLHNPNFRVYTSHDLIGVQICGAVKNILAIATGINDGLKLGANSRCALITRGLAEMTRLGMAMGAQRETFMGLAGVGDLVLTATDDQSRNRRFGLSLGAGQNIELAKQEIGLVEGAGNAGQIKLLAEKFGVDMPICREVYRIVYEVVSPLDAMRTLLTRELKAEH